METNTSAQPGRNVILTGIKPTGVPHIGNYVGAIAPAIRRANEFDEAYFFIADYHALNVIQDPSTLRQLTYSVAATWLAAGLDPSVIYFYRQSDIQEIFELETILNTVTPKGWMNKMHAYKAQVQRNETAGRAPDDAVNMGLYTYPLLMASDILALGSHVVPVGKDQVQHVEIARDIADRFNKQFRTQALISPRYVLETGIEELPGIDGRKMSKNYANTIPVFADRPTWERSVKKIVTDSKQHTPETLRDTVFYKIYAAVATEDQVIRFMEEFVAGTIGWGAAKARLVDALEYAFGDASRTYLDLMNNPEKIDSVLQQGANPVRRRARVTLSAVKNSIGI